MKKRICVSVLFILLFVSSIVLATDAEPTNLFPSGFSGRVDSSWGYVTNNYLKDSGEGYATVLWKKSSQSSAHNMWFRVVNSNGAERGKSLLNYLTSKDFNTSTTYNYNYWLQARRENSVDPATTISGSWNL